MITVKEVMIVANKIFIKCLKPTVKSGWSAILATLFLGTHHSSADLCTYPLSLTTLEFTEQEERP